jgi:hypothetical protein
MKPWARRPTEEANLLNPAFCCVTLTASVSGYASIDPSGIPYPLTFLVLPIVLHKATRDKLPHATTTSLAAWIQGNAEAKVQFADRVIAFKPYTREALMFGLLHAWLVLSQGGRIQTTLRESDAERFVRRLDDETKDCVRRARFVGRWFASASTAQTVMALWGIRP